MCAVLAGCTEMQVRKITASSRACGSDANIKGMRYYLSRPYVLVNRPILITERRQLFVAHPDGSPITTEDGALPPKTAPGLSYDNKSGSGTAGIPSTAEQADNPINRGADLTTIDPGSTSTKPGADGSTIVSAVSRGVGSAGIPIAPQLPPEAPANDHKLPDLAGDIQIVFLPDLDEQYAVHGCNTFSKQAYGLRFEEGWKLTGVNVEQDATPVPLEFLNLISKAIQSARNVAETAVNPKFTSSGSGALPGFTDQSTPGLVGRDPTANLVLYERVTRTYLQPGLYRLTKPWEMDAAPAVGTGLLAQLGLPTIDRTETRIASPQNLKDVLPADAQ
jgi:hypothetical protein